MSQRVSLVLLAVTACVVPEDIPPTTTAEQYAWNDDEDCEVWGCGMNSPEVDNLGLHELALDGSWTPAYWRITKITKEPDGQTEYSANVYRAQVSATPVGGGTTLNGGAVVGLVFHVENRNGAKYVIRLMGLDRTTFFAKPNGTAYLTATYLVGWDILRPPGSHYVWKNVCSKPVSGSPDNLGMNEHQSVLFEHDRIVAATKAVTHLSRQYFNIGCAGHALAKLHLTGHTQAAKSITGGVMTTDLAQRTTMLKTLSADYCGTGTAFTVAGEPLEWKTANGWMGYSSPAPTLEARWDASGATCLHETRLDTTTYPTLLDDIANECGGSLPPSCATADQSTDANNLAGKYLVSGNP